MFFTLEGEGKEFRLGGLVTHSEVDHTLTGEHDRTLGSLNGVYNFSAAPFKFTTGLRADYTSDFDFSRAAMPGSVWKSVQKP